jgi:hypothetical protein
MSKDIALLNWVRKIVKPYGLEVPSWTKGWEDGLVFNAILHNFEPNMVDFQQLDKKNAIENIKHAFDQFEKLGIEPLLEVRDAG